MRARYADLEDFVERNGASVFYEIYENEAPTTLLAQTWEIVHSRHWKLMIPYLSRHFRVVTYDPVGNGRSDRIDRADRYAADEQLKDAIGVLDATGTASCVAVGASYGGGLVTMLAALYPERFDGIVPISASHRWGVPIAERDSDEWYRYDPEYWRKDWDDFVEFFFGEAHSDAHSTKAFDDSVRWPGKRRERSLPQVPRPHQFLISQTSRKQFERSISPRC